MKDISSIKNNDMLYLMLMLAIPVGNTTKKQTAANTAQQQPLKQ